MNLFNELKRRNVFRIAGIYAVVGWILMQVAGTLEESLNLPVWFDSVITAGLLIGFPVALLLAWAFEMTPEGVKPTESVEGDANTASSSKKMDSVIIVGIVLILVLGLWQQMTKPVMTQSKATEIKTTEIKTVPSAEIRSPIKIVKEAEIVDASIAVLAFSDLSQAGDQGYFSDGIAEEILNVLVRIDSLKVASRTSAFGFKGQEALGIPTIAKRLKVRHVLEGSVRRSGDTVRITAQLIDAQTDTHLWSETFDRELTTKNIFAVQDEIAGAIVKQLGLIIGGKEATTRVKVATQSLDAYELYLKAQELYHVRSEDNLPKIVKLYEKALAIDPDFAEAWAGLSATYLVFPGWGLGTREDYFPKAKKAAERASQLDDKLALPYTISGGIASMEGDAIWAIEQMDKALELDPKSLQTVYFRAAIILDLGYFNQAESGFRHCLELDPNYEICRRFLLVTLLFKGNTKKANELFLAALLKGQMLYMGAFVDYYGSIGDTQGLTFMLSGLYKDDFWMRELMYKFHTDNSYSLDAFNTDVRSNNLHHNGEDTPDDDFSIQRAADQFLGDFLWSPYQPILRRPELRNEYLRIQRKKIQKYGLDDYWRKHGFPPQCRAVGDDDFECD